MNLINIQSIKRKTRLLGSAIGLWGLVGALMLVSCSSPLGVPNSAPPSIGVSVNPSSVTVAAGSMTAFSAMYTPTVPTGGSLTWSVTPTSGGSITSAGLYTAPGTTGTYTVIATWNPSSPGTGASVSGSATVGVLPAPQPGAELNDDLIQASVSNQASGTIQNGTATGQLVPSVILTDASGNIQIRSGFDIPVACTGSSNICP